jgi:membrane protein
MKEVRHILNLYHERWKLVVFCILAAVGFATGMHYAGILGAEQIEAAKGCFEFGLWALFSGGGYGACMGSLALSCLKNYGMFILGCFSWLLFLTVPITLFGIGFKTGVCFSFVAAILRWRGIMEIAFMMLISLIILASAVLMTVAILNRCIYHQNLKRWDNTDKNFFFHSLTALGAYFICFAVLLALCCFTHNNLNGFFNTFL